MKPRPLRVAISGAGVAGPGLAHWLLRHGHVPTLIEQSPVFRTGGYMVNFWGAGFRVAQRMGLEDALRAEGYRVQRLDAVGSDGSVGATIEVDDFESRARGGCVSLPRGVLARIVYATVAGRCETLFGDSISAIEEREADIVLTLAGGARRAFDLLVGADGLHSNVRRLAFGAHAGYERPLGCWVAACVVEDYQPRDEGAFVTHDARARHVARFSLRGNRTLLLFVRRESVRRIPDELPARKALVREAFAGTGWECPRMLEALEQVDELYVDQVSQVHMPQWSRGRVALVGDAAASVSLIGGEGTGLALAEGYVLAGELARAGADHARAFHAYEQRLRPIIEREQAAARDMAGFVAGEGKVSLRTMNQPWLNGLISGLGTPDDVILPEYAPGGQAASSEDAPAHG